jgi:hypothetical protein
MWPDAPRRPHSITSARTLFLISDYLFSIHSPDREPVGIGVKIGVSNDAERRATFVHSSNGNGSLPSLLRCEA